jgi:predicted dehydrogenase
MVNSARKHGWIVQVGSQQRSGSHYINAINLIRQGTLGGVHHITANYTRNKVPGFVKKVLTFMMRTSWIGSSG